MRGSRERERGHRKRGECGRRERRGIVVVTSWFENELRSLNLEAKMKAKMGQKMTIFAKVRIGFDFLKMIIFESF